MKIFYCGIKYDDYNPARGTSFEHENFYESLRNFPGALVEYFPFDDIIKTGKRKWNENLLRRAEAERPDLIFCFMLSDEFDRKTLAALKTVTTTLAWFADDHWRFDNYSRFWAPHFSWAITTYSKAVEWHKQRGFSSVIRSQWAANTVLYKPALKESVIKAPDVCFVGSWSKPREAVIFALRRVGIEVMVRGGGWREGRATEEEMTALFSSSKINLALNPPPGFWNVNSLGRLFFRRSMDKVVPDFHFFRNAKTFLARGIPQIKARHFEIPACGGFVITSSADDLENYYVPDKEMVMYQDIPDLAEKVKYYLVHDAEREAIARAGYERTIRDHTYEKRLREIFKKIGLGV